jgi:site-specific DNA-methyltransferase (adenine-specific)
MTKEDFIQEGFNVVETENNENKLLHFLKEHYPNVIKDGEINLNELKAIAGLPIDEKVNGYGLNFVGRNFARAKYAQKTAKELKLNTDLSKNIDTTQNLVLKGDNLDSLKILKSYYTGKIKCIYIDPPYNTKSDEFIYPDKFNKEETEVLGLANLSDDDFARMDFSFKTKKSHNGWLSFMYPRLLLARDLLRDDGVIFISIDDNEQANLKLLCDDVFGEENFVASFIVIRSEGGGLAKKAVIGHDYMLAYSKNISEFTPLGKPKDIRGKIILRNNEEYWIETDWLRSEFGKYGTLNYEEIAVIKGQEKKCEIDEGLEKGDYVLIKKGQKHIVGRYRKVADDTSKFYTILKHLNKNGVDDLKQIELNDYFDFPKPLSLVKEAILGATIKNKDSIILDFFAGSGTTGHAVMQLNAEDGGNRKFILCQIDEHIKKDKPAYKFCVENKLPPVISSITIERLKRAGEKIAKEFKAEAGKPDLFEKDKKQMPDIGFKVFDSVDAPKLEIDENGQISILFNDNDALSRIYNMIFTVGLDEPAQKPEEVIKDCIYKIGNNYYITNSERISKDNFADAIKNGKVFIDGWTASLSGTLQNYKEDVKIVF